MAIGDRSIPDLSDRPADVITNNVTINLSNTLDKTLTTIMTDVPTFLQGASEGRYRGNLRPSNPNDIKNELSLALQAYLTSQSLKRTNGTQSSVRKALKITPKVSPRALRYGQFYRRPAENIYWSPASHRQYVYNRKGPLTRLELA